jgi:ATP-dependent helicase HrpA
METADTKTERDFDKLYGPIHRSILAGNLSGLAQRDSRFEYTVCGGGKFVLWPGSGLQKKNVSRQRDVQTDTEKSGLPHWIMAAERLETSRKYLRTAAQIDVNWIEPLAQHLIQCVYLEPHWDSETGYVHAFEKVSLFGIVIVPKRRINYGPIDPKLARDIFIQSALVEEDMKTNLEFFVHNQSLLSEAIKMQDKVRQPDIIKPESARYQFYQERIPDEVFDRRSLEKYAKEHSTQHWFMTLTDLCGRSADVSAFPDKLQTFDIEYRYAPGDADDGLTVLVPQENLRQLEPARLGWLVPGLIEQKMSALLKSLPKEIRCQIVPIPDTVKEMMSKIRFGEGDLEGQICKEVTRLVGRIVVPTDFNIEQLPPELRMNVRVLDTEGNVLKESKDFLSLRKELAPTEIVHVEKRRVEKEFYEAHKREIKTQIQYLPNGDKLKLYARTLPQFDFHEEVGLLIAARALAMFPPPEGAGTLESPLPFGERVRGESCEMSCRPLPNPLPEGEGTFEYSRLNGEGIIVAVQEVTKVIVPILETYHQAKLAIERNKPHPSALEAEEHLSRLILPGFLSATDWNYLREYPRYFRGVPMRFEKLRSGGEAADRQGVEELSRYWQKYLERRELHDLAGIADPELEVFRWMIEEYRVSLFAQRLDRQLERVKR